MLGLAHTLVAEGRHDQGFLDRYCAGYDTFERYLLGETDGVPKDAAWAGTGVRHRARGDPAPGAAHGAARTLVTVTWSLQRAQHGEQPVWAALALAAMLGQIGLPGGGFGHGYGSMGDVGGHGPVLRLPTLRQGHNPVRTFIPVARIADMLLNPGAGYDYDGRRYRYPDIRLVYWAGGNPFHHHQDLGRLRAAFARPDTIVVHEPHWTATARHADIVLPVTTSLEREDIGSGRRDTHLIAMHRAVPPAGQARNDHDILAGLAARLGLEAAFTEGRDPAPVARAPVRRVARGHARRRARGTGVRGVLGGGRTAAARRARALHAVRVVPGRPGAVPAAHPERPDRDHLGDRGRLRLRRLPRAPGLAGAR